MKKRNIIIIIVAILVMATVAITLVACDNPNDALAKRNAELKRVASATVGIEGYNATSSNVTTDSNGNFVVEVVIEGVVYDVTIDEAHNVVSVKINDRQVDTKDIPTAPFGDDEKYIGRDEAKKIALEDANAPLDTLAKVEFDFDDGMYLYEVEFNFDGHEYEYDINAENGNIHKIDKDRRTEYVPNNSQNPDKQYITAEQAEQAALAHAQVLENDVIAWERTEFDYDKGTYVYEVEFATANAEYEYDINAITGAVIKHKVETFATGGNQDTQGLISAEEAKTHALNHAGITDLSTVYGMKAELDYEFNKRVYEIEFKVGAYEYEYEIDATTGAVLRAEKELND